MTSRTHSSNIRETVSTILSIARWTGIVPVTTCDPSGKHSSVENCCFKVSKFWSIFSICFQVFVVPFVIILIIDLLLGFTTTDVLWNANKIMLIIHEIELYSILILGVTQAKYMANILNHLSKMPSRSEDLVWIRKFLKITLTALLSFFGLYSAMHMLHIWLERDTIQTFAVKNFSKSIVGIVLHNYLTIFTQIQCMVSVMFCLLICSKFKYLTNLIQVTFNKKSWSFSTDKNIQSILVKSSDTNLSTLSTRSNNLFQIDSDFLEELHLKYCEINDCLDEINKRIGFQLLISISVILYTLIFFLFCEISVKGSNTRKGYNDDITLITASIFGTIVLIIRITMYMWAGHKIKEQTGGPLQALQRSKILHHNQQLQQQIQTILLQWSSTEPGFLSAFHIMNVGPWLLTSIIGNVITYLLVFIQISKASGE